MNEAVGGYIHKKYGTALCVHCVNDHVQSRYISLSESSLNDGLICTDCERTLSSALREGPPVKPVVEEEDQEELDLEMGGPDVFGAEEAPKRKRRRKKKEKSDGNS